MWPSSAAIVYRSPRNSVRTFMRAPTAACRIRTETCPWQLQTSTDRVAPDGDEARCCKAKMRMIVARFAAASTQVTYGAAARWREAGDAHPHARERLLGARRVRAQDQVRQPTPCCQLLSHLSPAPGILTRPRWMSDGRAACLGMPSQDGHAGPGSPTMLICTHERQETCRTTAAFAKQPTGRSQLGQVQSLPQLWT